MKATELMVGDLVIHGFGGIGKITEIDSKTVVIKDDGFDTGDGMNEVSFALNELTPIPLTPEILEQNGFVKQAYDGWLISEENGRGLIEYRTDCFDGLLRINYNKKPFSKLMVKVKYIHELQHALRLCGIDKEITI